MLEENRLKQEAENAIAWIREYVNSSKAKGVIIGLSGGKDSAVVLAMLVRAIGKDNVLAVSMPCNSITEDYDDAKLVADVYGVRFATVDLTETYNIFEKTINNEILKFDENELVKEAKVNIKPRLRMTTLYGIAQTYGYLVAGTGNLSEKMVGYTTKWGDSATDFNPIANFTVSEVLAIGSMLGVPQKILQKAPSDGLGGQTDEEKMGIKYSQIEEMIETGNTDENAKQIILRKFELSKHKRASVPTYEFKRKNYLLDN